MYNTQDVIIRLLVALALSGVVGLQRSLTGKAAGMRTHILVGVGSAIFTLVSGYAFHAMGSSADRIAAQVVSGIGFIGGGAILKDHGSIKGLTTAAGLWAAAALGMAAGAGLYDLGVIGAAVILLTLVVLRRFELRMPRRALESWTIRVTVEGQALPEPLQAVLRPHCRRLSLTDLIQDDAVRTALIFSVEMPHHADLGAITGELRAAGAHTVAWHTGNGESGA